MTKPLRRFQILERDLKQAQEENRVRGECLEIAMRALEWYGQNCPVLLCGTAGEALDKIKQRLAQLEPEEEEPG